MRYHCVSYYGRLNLIAELESFYFVNDYPYNNSPPYKTY